MDVAPSSRRLFRIAGVVLWLTAALPAIVLLTRILEQAGPRGPAIWIGAFAGFGAAFWRSTAIAESDRRRPLLIAVQSVCALTMFHIVCTGFESTLLVLVAALIGMTLPLRQAAVWIAAQTLVMGWLGTYHWPAAYALWWTGGTFGLEVFGLLVASFAASESRARGELAAVNAELRTARSLLAHSSRAHERVRISRELHDLLGHHLTGLSLDLEVARCVAGDDAREPIARAQTATKKLLGDVRATVDVLRERPDIDLGDTLRQLATEIEAPSIHVKMPERLDLDDAELAHALARCAQEIVTNAVRHAGADNLHIELRHVAGAIELEGTDDGAGARAVAIGNGLRGMRERVEELGGELELDTEPGRGFAVRVRVPRPGSSS